MIVQANGKINLTLDIVGVKENGYHLIESIFLPIALSDEIIIEINKDEKKDVIAFSDTSVNCNNNTVKTALNLIKEKFNIKDYFYVEVRKNIPLGSGLGGGSSDAAAIIKGFNELLNLKMSLKEMIELGAKVGADVPFFIINKPAIIRGIGENISEISLLKTNVLLVKSKSGIDTKEAYKKYDEIGGTHGNFKKVLEAYEDRKLTDLGKNVYNSLENAAFSINTLIEKVKEDLKTAGFPVVLMSGSGSTVFALTDDVNKAKNYLRKVDKTKYEAWLTTTL
jgi:4-diphosphocytidyl-2C-methyl-D-erythritol kinase